MQKLAGPLVLLIAACAPSSVHQRPAPARPELSPEGLAAYEVLRATQRFTDEAIYDGGDTPVEVIALRHLWAEPEAAAAFRSLLAEADAGGQLFALCGLYYSDRETFRREVERFRRDERTVFFQTGCVGLRDTPVRELVESPHALVVRLDDPDQTVKAWVTARGADGGYRYDILGGGYPNEFKTGGGYHEVRTQPLDAGAR